MTKAAPLSGKWRIVRMALWDKDFLDMMEPAYIAFDGKAGGEFAFGCVTGDLHCRKTPRASTSPGKATMKWTKRPATVGLNFKRIDRSRAKSASTMATTRPSKPADGEFFSSLLERSDRQAYCRSPAWLPWPTSN